MPSFDSGLHRGTCRYNAMVREPGTFEPRAVSIVIPVHNGEALFRSCLQSVSRLQPAPLEVIVVADGDTDGSSEVAREHGMWVALLP